jgi:hypothetical protein
MPMRILNLVVYAIDIPIFKHILRYRTLKGRIQKWGGDHPAP